MKIAIIGAGMAGLSAAHVLKAGGIEVSLFDKGRGPGGRMSTRRAQTPAGETRFDHGAQFFTARGEAFREAVARWRQQGAADQWMPRLADIRQDGGKWTVGIRPQSVTSEPIHVGLPSMNAIIKAMADGHEINWNQRVRHVQSEGAEKWLHLEDGREAGPFHFVVSAVPAEQVADLLATVSLSLADEARSVNSAPCWAVMLAFEGRPNLDWDAANVAGAPISWIARNGSKPGRDAIEAWVLHASPQWTKAHVDMDREDVAHQLLQSFRSLTGAGEPIHSAAHRWLYARVEQGVGKSFGWDASAGVAAIGDWRLAPRIEAAWQSGHDCGKWLLSQP